MSAFKRIIKTSLPFDRRHPDPSKNYGIHGLDLFFILVGKKGAVQFAATFGIFLPHVQEELESKATATSMLGKISGIDVGYHSKVPMYEGQRKMECDLVGKECYYDGSGTRANQWADEIFSGKHDSAEDKIWAMLKDEYNLRFEENNG